MVKFNTEKKDARFIHAPMTLFPTPYPMTHFKKAFNYQIPLGTLIANIVRDPRQNIHKILAEFSKVDHFMARLIEVSEAFQKQRERGEPTQDIHMCVLRTDYMLDWPSR